MRILKNRGDIFFSKNNKEKSKEQKILIITLIVIVIFTVVFLIAVGAKNDFSVKKFFEPENLSTSGVSVEQTAQLPQVSGKTNYLITVSSDSSLLFAEILQVDLDNTSYKLCTLKADTEYDGSTLEKIYSKSGIQNVKAAVENMFSAQIDYYIAFESDKYSQLFDKLGTVNYAVASDIRYKNSGGSVPFNIKIKAGEQKLKGSQTINLVRYYLEKENNTAAANDLLLTSLSQQINGENYENKDSFFNELVTDAETNITVRDYSGAQDAITVLCNSQNSISVYGAAVMYEKSNITQESLNEAKGYFKK